MNFGARIIQHYGCVDRGGCHLLSHLLLGGRIRVGFNEV